MAEKTAVADYHVIIKENADLWCMTIWDSVSGKTLFDSCSSDYLEVAKQGVKAMGSAIWTFLTNGNWIAKAAVIGVLSAVFIDLIIPGDPVPLFPLGMRQSDGGQFRNVSMSTSTGSSNDV